MEWWTTLLIIFGALIVLMFLRFPVAFCFIAINLVGALFLFGGGEKGLQQLAMSIFSSVTNFGLVPVPLFILMGEVLFQTGMAYKAIDIVDKWLGRLPGRLSIVTILSAVMFSAMSGSSLGTVAMLGSVMTPEMERRGYKKPISLGATMGGGGLDAIIPPSSLAVILGTLGEIPIGPLLIAGILPGLMMAGLYLFYLVGRCVIQPDLAPLYTPEHIPLGKKISDTLKYLVPFVIIMLLVLGSIFFGIATPTESSALGAFACFILAALYGKLDWFVIKKSTMSTVRVTVMLLMIIAGATFFSQIIAYTGASKGFAAAAISLNLSPMMLVVAMEIIVIILGCFMDPVAILMIMFPIFVPILNDVGFDMVLFGLITLINANLGGRTPPFGMILFVMKSVAPKDTTWGDIWGASLPFVICDILSMVIILNFPVIALFLPSFMTY